MTVNVRDARDHTLNGVCSDGSIVVNVDVMNHHDRIPQVITDQVVAFII